MTSAPRQASAPVILSVERGLPAHRASQEQILQALQTLWAERHYNPERLERLHRSVQVSGRHLALPMELYPQLSTFHQRNSAWIESATALGEQVARGALERARLRATEVDHVLFVTVTGIATPSIDARLVPRLGLRPDVRRTPVFGLGCVAGAAGLARAADYLWGQPEQTALVLAVELCSLTLQPEDVSIPNLVATGLFGDGAACVALGGHAHLGAGPRVVASRSVLYPGTERLMGWEVTDSGFKVVLSAQVPQLVRRHLRRDVEAFLAAHGLGPPGVRHWVVHTGGPKVLQAIQEALELPDEALEASWASLREVGNLSSASVLFVLAQLLESQRARPGDWGLMLSMGPGFCAELVLLRW